MTGGLKRWRLVHTWSSLICTAFMFVLCVTGLPLVFRDEIDALLRPHPHAQALPESTPALGTDRLIEIARARHPDRFVSFVFWDPDSPHVVGLGLSAEARAGLANMTRELVDERTGAALGSEPAEGSLTDQIAELHRNLCAGTVGDLLLSLMALAFLASLVSGVVVYWPLLRRIGFAAIRKERTRHIYTLDLHNLLSMIGLLWALVVGATGFINTLEAPLFAAWDQAMMPALLARYQGKPRTTRRASVDQAVAAARSALPGMRVTSVGFPESPFATPRHYLIWTQGRTLFTSRMFTPVLIDAESGELASARPFPWYLSALELSRPLHFGDYGGLPLKLLWALMDVLLISVLVTGLYLWLRRPRSRASTRED